MIYMRSTLGTHRAHILLPEELVANIDALVGQRGRSAFLVEAAQHEVRRRTQIAALKAATGSWHDEDHPELAQGSEAWVRNMREESETHFQQTEDRRSA